MAEKEIKTFWLTKYALSDGILEVEGEVGDGSSEGYAWAKLNANSYPSIFKIGTAAFSNKSDAIINAIERRDKKIASLKKQIAKLEKLKFEELV